MPSFTKDGVAVAGRTRTLIFVTIEKNILQTLTILDLSGAIRPNQTYAEIGIMSGGTDPQHKIASLASGYIGKDQPVAWSGKIVTESDMYAFAHVYSTPGGSFRLAGLVLPIKITDDGGFIIDP